MGVCFSSIWAVSENAAGGDQKHCNRDIVFKLWKLSHMDEKECRFIVLSHYGM